MAESSKPDRNNPPPVHYGEYLCLEKLLDCQHLESKKYGPPAHDEMLFIITHQAYELWFKQIVHELKAVADVFNDQKVEETEMGRVIHLLSRIKTIQKVLLEQIDIIETMTPLDFLEFRDLLVPASGFQSIQFKQVEILLGIKREQRSAADRDFFFTRLRPEEQTLLLDLESKPSLLELADRWLSRMPFLNFGSFDFWKQYQQAVQSMLARDRKIVTENPAISDVRRDQQLANLDAMERQFTAILDENQYEELREKGEFRLSHRAFLASLFIHLYRDQPILHLPFRFLTLLVEIDQLMTSWRSRHSLMVQRMLGRKIGTGGSSGADYLDETTKKNRVFLDLYSISTFLLPRNELPKLSGDLQKALDFRFS